MAQLTRATLKGLWVSGYKPTENDYSDLFDSFYNKESDTLVAGVDRSIQFNDNGAFQGSNNLTFDENGNFARRITLSAPEFSGTNKSMYVESDNENDKALIYAGQNTLDFDTPVQYSFKVVSNERAKITNNGLSVYKGIKALDANGITFKQSNDTELLVLANDIVKSNVAIRLNNDLLFNDSKTVKISSDGVSSDFEIINDISGTNNIYQAGDDPLDEHIFRIGSANERAKITNNGLSVYKGIKALDANGIDIQDDGGNTAISIADGGNLSLGLDNVLDIDAGGFKFIDENDDQLALLSSSGDLKLEGLLQVSEDIIFNSAKTVKISSDGVSSDFEIINDISGTNNIYQAGDDPLDEHIFRIGASNERAKITNNGLSVYKGIKALDANGITFKQSNDIELLVLANDIVKSNVAIQLNNSLTFNDSKTVKITSNGTNSDLKIINAISGTSNIYQAGDDPLDEHIFRIGASNERAKITNNGLSVYKGIKALDANGIDIQDDGGNIVISIADGGNLSLGLDNVLDIDAGGFTFNKSGVEVANFDSDGLNVDSVKILSDNGIAFRNSSDTILLKMFEAGVVSVVSGSFRIQDIPTSASGLASGDVWSDSGTLKIVS